MNFFFLFSSLSITYVAWGGFALQNAANFCPIYFKHVHLIIRIKQARKLFLFLSQPDSRTPSSLGALFYVDVATNTICSPPPPPFASSTIIESPPAGPSHLHHPTTVPLTKTTLHPSILASKKV